MTTEAQLQAKIQTLIAKRDRLPPGPEKAAYRKEIQALERQLAIGRAMTARDMGRALFQSDVWAPTKFERGPEACADIASYFGRVLIGRNLMAGRTVRLDLENGHHVVCTLEKV